MQNYILFFILLAWEFQPSTKFYPCIDTEYLVLVFIVWAFLGRLALNCRCAVGCPQISPLGLSSCIKGRLKQYFWIILFCSIFIIAFLLIKITIKTNYNKKYILMFSWLSLNLNCLKIILHQWRFQLDFWRKNSKMKCLFYWKLFLAFREVMIDVLISKYFSSNWDTLMYRVKVREILITQHENQILTNIKNVPKRRTTKNKKNCFISEQYVSLKRQII